MKKKNSRKENKRKKQGIGALRCSWHFLISSLLPFFKKTKEKYDFLSLLVGFEENACNNEDVH